MMEGEELARFIAQLPEHLRFFFDPPPPGLEAEGLIAFSRERLQKVREHLDELLAHGVQADLFLARAEPTVANLEHCDAEVQKAEDELLHRRADFAESLHELFKAWDSAVKQAEEENPFDPQVQEWREQIEELRKQFPKE